MTEKEILNLYSEGVSGYKLEHVYGEKRSRLYAILNQAGITRNYCTARHPIGYNSSIFKEENLNAESWYWVGFLFADGCLHSKEPRIQIGLAEKDKKHIEKFREYLKVENKIFPYITKPSKITKGGFLGNALYISNKEMYEDLLKLGCTPKKSLTLKWPNLLKEEFLFDFIRGYFDGDGYFVKKPKESRFYMGFCGTKDFLKELANNLDVSENLVHKTRIIWALDLYSEIKPPTLTNIINKIYFENSPKYYLERKHKQAQEIVAALGLKTEERNRAKTVKADKIENEKLFGKCCKTCKICKSLSQYRINNQTYDKLSIYCKECEKSYTKTKRANTVLNSSISKGEESV